MTAAVFWEYDKNGHTLRVIQRILRPWKFRMWLVMMVCSLLFLLLLQSYNPTWALASLILRLQASPSYVNLLQFLHFNILLASLSTSCYHLPLGLPTGLLLSVYTFSAFLDTLSSILIAWPTHCSHRYMMFLISSISLCKLQISWFYLSRQWWLVVLQVPKGEGAHSMLFWEVISRIRLHYSTTLMSTIECRLSNKWRQVRLNLQHEL